MKLQGSLLVLLLVGIASPSFANTYYVNSTRDALDINLSDGVCWTGSLISDGSQECTLRAALQEANIIRTTRPTHRVFLPAGTFFIGLTPIAAAVEELDQARGTMTIEEANMNRDFDLRSNVWLTGAGTGATFIDGANGDRVFDIIGTGLPANMIFEQLTIRRGSTRGDGACIRNLATRGIIYLTDVVIENCVARESRGGGLFNLGAVIMTRVRFRENSAMRGGGLENATAAVAQIYDSTFERNTGQISITLTSQGGAIHNQTGAALTLWQSTLSDNSSGAGGGLYNDGNATLVNTTISGNSGRGGGAVFVNRGDDPGSLWLINSTVTQNEPPGILRVGGGNVQLRETIVAGNTDYLGRTVNCEGGILGSLESLEDANTCSLTGEGNIINTDPLLGPLADNGGPTQTHALLPGSPAIDAAGTPNERRDQRGFPRPIFGAGDIGAFEKGFDFTLLIPIDWTFIFPGIVRMSDSSYRVDLSLQTLAKGSDLTEARIIGAKAANGQAKFDLSKDGGSMTVDGLFVPPKDGSSSTLFYLEVVPAVNKSSQLKLSNAVCDCDAKPRKSPPTIVIPSAEKAAKQQ